MNIIEAAKIVLDGRKVRRKSWVKFSAHIWIGLNSQNEYAWDELDIDSEDILANDWEIVDEHN